MNDHVFNIAKAKMHLSRLIERVERGDTITITRNNRPVAMLMPARPSEAAILARIDQVRTSIGERNGGRMLRDPSESWRDIVAAGRRI